MRRGLRWWSCGRGVGDWGSGTGAKRYSQHKLILAFEVQSAFLVGGAGPGIGGIGDLVALAVAAAIDLAAVGGAVLGGIQLELQDGPRMWRL